MAAVIVSAVRTPVGKAPRGALRHTPRKLARTQVGRRAQTHSLQRHAVRLVVVACQGGPVEQLAHPLDAVAQLDRLGQRLEADRVLGEARDREERWVQATRDSLIAAEVPTDSLSFHIDAHPEVRHARSTRLGTSALYRARGTFGERTTKQERSLHARAP
mgnify:CR=1 FL=1